MFLLQLFSAALHHIFIYVNRGIIPIIDPDGPGGRAGWEGKEAAYNAYIPLELVKQLFLKRDHAPGEEVTYQR